MDKGISTPLHTVTVRKGLRKKTKLVKSDVETREKIHCEANPMGSDSKEEIGQLRQIVGTLQQDVTELKLKQETHENGIELFLVTQSQMKNLIEKMNTMEVNWKTEKEEMKIRCEVIEQIAENFKAGWESERQTWHVVLENLAQSEGERKKAQMEKDVMFRRLEYVQNVRLQNVHSEEIFTPLIKNTHPKHRNKRYPTRTSEQLSTPVRDHPGISPNLKVTSPSSQDRSEIPPDNGTGKDDIPLSYASAARAMESSSSQPVIESPASQTVGVHESDRVGVTDTQGFITVRRKSKESYRLKNKVIIGTGRSVLIDDGNLGLTASRKKIWIHLGRISKEESLVRVEKYLKSKLPDEQFVVEQISHPEAIHKSFKIGADSSLLKALNDADFWPQGATIRRFFIKHSLKPPPN